MSGLEMVAVAVTALAIWLTARRHMLCWPLNVLACALYFKLFLDVRLYADMVLQALFGLAILYGWREWARAPAQAGEAAGPVAVAPLPAAQALAALAAGALGALAIGWFTSHYT
ncbi:MAG TPA: nicotinamide mononucleotide transporter family protein, partial [Novosphingobium sp.]|nr:nicotinamide mononucleotide transporter family protein [Novosphingobium sp.]